MEMLGAITGLIGAGLQAKAQAEQAQIQWANLMFQKQNAAKQQRFAGAGRSDAFGNKTSYDDILNEWKIALTPTQKRITQAGETEQLRSLTEDAARNRRQKERSEKTALQAGGEFQDALARYKYDAPASELATRDELERLMLTGNKQRAKDNQGIIARQALRLGKGADIAKIIQKTDDELGKDSPNIALQARQGALQERGARIQQHQTILPELQNWEQLMAAGGGDAQLKFSNVGQELQAMQGGMANAIQSAMQSGGAAIGGAYNALGSAMGKSPDFTNAVRGFTGNMRAGRSSTPKYSVTKPAANPDENRWDKELPWGSTGNYLDNMDYGDWVF